MSGFSSKQTTALGSTSLRVILLMVSDSTLHHVQAYTSHSCGSKLKIRGLGNLVSFTEYERWNNWVQEHGPIRCSNPVKGGQTKKVIYLCQFCSDLQTEKTDPFALKMRSGRNIERPLWATLKKRVFFRKMLWFSLFSLISVHKGTVGPYSATMVCTHV